jgi:hypothetical protein
MNARNIWNRVVRRVMGLPREMRSEWAVRGRMIAAGNASVQSRQVLRAQARRDAMDLVKEIAGGEPRRNRRKMALAMARRDWRPAAA